MSEMSASAPIKYTIVQNLGANIPRHDLDDILSLWTKCYPEAVQMAGHFEYSEALKINNSQQCMHYIRVFAGEKLVGVFDFLAKLEKNGRVVFVDKIAVDPDHRGRGVARKMLDIFTRDIPGQYPDTKLIATAPSGSGAKIAKSLGLAPSGNKMPVLGYGYVNIWTKVMSVALLLPMLWSAWHSEKHSAKHSKSVSS
jgi:GNAT superfamily N-acetyltransferase